MKKSQPEHTTRTRKQQSKNKTTKNITNTWLTWKEEKNQPDSKVEIVPDTGSQVNIKSNPNRKTTKSNGRTENTFRTKIEQHQLKTRTNKHGNKKTKTTTNTDNKKEKKVKPLHEPT